MYLYTIHYTRAHAHIPHLTPSNPHLNVTADDGKLHCQPEDDAGHKRIVITTHLGQVLPCNHTQSCRHKLGEEGLMMEEEGGGKGREGGEEERKEGNTVPAGKQSPWKFVGMT